MISFTDEARSELGLRSPDEQRAFEKLFGRISEISSLPTAAMEIMRVSADPSTGADDLLAAVESDPSLAARIIRTVNTAFYGLRREIADLKTAITMLGFREVRNLAMTAYVAQLFRDTSGHGPYRREDLWTHSVAVATGSRLIARQTKSAMPEECYLAGLLHDVGYILLDQCLHRHFCEVLDALTNETPTPEIETAALGFDHTELGEYAAKAWGFPELVTAAIRFHHAPASYRGQYTAVVYIVTLANYLCSCEGLSALGMRNVRTPPETVFTTLGIEKDELAHIWNDLSDSLSGIDALAAI